MPCYTLSYFLSLTNGSLCEMFQLCVFRALLNLPVQLSISQQKITSIRLSVRLWLINSLFLTCGTRVCLHSANVINKPLIDN